MESLPRSARPPMSARRIDASEPASLTATERRVIGRARRCDDVRRRDRQPIGRSETVAALDSRVDSSCPSRKASISISSDVAFDMTGGAVHLRPREFELLATLASNPGRAFTRASIDRSRLGLGRRDRTTDRGRPRPLAARQDRVPAAPADLPGHRPGLRLPPRPATASRGRGSFVSSSGPSRVGLCRRLRPKAQPVDGTGEVDASLGPSGAASVSSIPAANVLGSGERAQSAWELRARLTSSPIRQDRGGAIPPSSRWLHELQALGASRTPDRRSHPRPAGRSGQAAPGIRGTWRVPRSRARPRRPGTRHPPGTPRRRRRPRGRRR